MKNVLILISRMSGQRQQQANQDRALTLLRGQGIEPALVDGSDPTQKDRRNELFGISGIRGNYPQFFITEDDQDPAAKTTFLGTFDDIDIMNDSATLTKEALGLAAPAPAPVAPPPAAPPVAVAPPAIAARGIEGQGDDDDDEKKDEKCCCGLLPLSMFPFLKKSAKVSAISDEKKAD